MRRKLNKQTGSRIETRVPRDGEVNASLIAPKDKVTLYIDQNLLKEFKHLAVEEDKTLSQLAQEALESFLRSRG